MKKYKVHFTKKLATTVEVEAETAEEAEDIAFYQLMRGMVELEGGNTFDDIEASVEKMTSEVEKEYVEE